jgi:hypothetical protein
MPAELALVKSGDIEIDESDPLEGIEQYWADLPGEQLGKEIVDRCNAFYAHPWVQAVLNRMWQGWFYYFGYGQGWVHGTSNVSRFGPKGVLASMRVNTVRRVATASTSGIIARNPVWQPVAGEVNSQSSRAIDAAAQVLDDAWHHQQVQRRMMLATESARFLSEGYVLPRWNRFAGRRIGADRWGRPAWTGAVTYDNILPWCNVRNPTHDYYAKGLWNIVVDRELKSNITYDASLPIETRRKVAAANDTLPANWFYVGIQTAPSSIGGAWDNDYVPVLRFFHKPCLALPRGREAVFLTDGTLLYDDDLLGDDIWLCRVVPDETSGMPFGYTTFWDGLAAQQVIDHLHSSAATNFGAFARQVIAMKKGESAANIQRLNDLAILWYEETKPEGVNMTAMPTGWERYLAIMENEVKQSMGQSDVSLGQSPGDRAPGNLAALLAAQTAQAATSFSGSYEDALKHLGRATITLTRENLKRMTSDMYRATISVGVLGSQGQRAGVRPVSADDLEGIEYVNVDLGDAMANSPSARVQAAEILANIPDPEARMAIYEVFKTGKLKPAVQGMDKAFTRIEEENEKLAQGIIPDVNPADDDMAHGIMHQIPMRDGVARNDPKALRSWNVHNAMHVQQEYGIPTVSRPNLADPWAPENDQFMAEIAAVPDYPLKYRRYLGKPPPLEIQQAQAAMGGPPGGTPPGAAKPTDDAAAKGRGPMPGGPARLPQFPTNAATGRSSATPDRGGVPQPGPQ